MDLPLPGLWQGSSVLYHNGEVLMIDHVKYRRNDVANDATLLGLRSPLMVAADKTAQKRRSRFMFGER